MNSIKPIALINANLALESQIVMAQYALFVQPAVKASGRYKKIKSARNHLNKTEK